MERGLNFYKKKNKISKNYKFIQNFCLEDNSFGKIIYIISEKGIFSFDFNSEFLLASGYKTNKFLLYIVKKDNRKKKIVIAEGIKKII